MKKIIYEDLKTSNQLEFFINDEKLLFLQCGDLSDTENPYYQGYICLSKEDVKDIIEHLQHLLQFM